MVKVLEWLVSLGNGFNQSKLADSYFHKILTCEHSSSNQSSSATNYMRFYTLLLFLCSSACVAGGAWLIALAPELVQTTTMRQLGTRLGWPGYYVLNRSTGCAFRPHFEQWESMARTLGWFFIAVGAGLALTCQWRLSKRPTPSPPGHAHCSKADN